MRLQTTFLICLSVALAACSGKTSASGTQPGSSSAYIQNTGSDTMVNLALAWAEQYQIVNADIRLSVTGGGSGTGISSLINGTVDIANASRAIKKEEIALAKERGFEPIEFVVARDAIGVIVNPHNPIDRLTLEQISKVFRGEYTNWKQLGGDDRPIVRISRETNSGTHIYFLETVIRLGSKTDSGLFSSDTLLLPSSQGIIAEVSDNPNAIGYDGLGYITPEVKTLAIAKSAGDQYILPTMDTVNDNSYAIARDLYMYTRGQPTGAIKAYLDWLSSTDAQKTVTQLGFIPVQKGQK